MKRRNLSRCLICGDLCGVNCSKLYDLDTGELHRCPIPEAEALSRRSLPAFTKRDKYGHTPDRHAPFGPGHTARVYHQARARRWRAILDQNYGSIENDDR